MTTRNLGYDANRVCPGMFSQLLSIIIPEMKKIKTEANKAEVMNNNIKRIYEPFTIIDSVIVDMVNQQIELPKIIKKNPGGTKKTLRKYAKLHFDGNNCCTVISRSFLFFLLGKNLVYIILH